MTGQTKEKSTTAFPNPKMNPKIWNIYARASVFWATPPAQTSKVIAKRHIAVWYPNCSYSSRCTVLPQTHGCNAPVVQMPRPKDDVAGNQWLASSGKSSGGQWLAIHKGRPTEEGAFVFLYCSKPPEYTASVLYLKEFLQRIVFARTLCLAS